MKRVALLASVMLPLMMGAPAVAQPEGTLQVTPSQVEVNLKTRAFTRTISYNNSGTKAVVVTLAVRRLGHDLDGAPRYLKSSDHEDAFTLSDKSFRVDPDETERVQLAGAIPSGERSMYFGVVATFSEEDSTGSVAVINQLASQFLLRAPKPWDKSAEITDAGLLPGEDGDVTVYADVKSTGNVHIRPTATVKIVQGGEELGTVKVGRPAGQEGLGPPIVIPSFTRRLVGTWTPPSSLNGSVSLIVDTDDPDTQGKGTVRLDASGNAAPVVHFDDLRVSNGAVVATLNNLGKQAVEDVSITFVAQESGSVERARAVLPVSAVGPGVSDPIIWEPSLSAGEYVILATAKAGSRVLDERIVEFVNTGGASTTASPTASVDGSDRTASEDPASTTNDLPWLPVTSAGLLLAAAAATLFVALHRRRATRTEGP